MNNLIQKWLKALRSGEYKQGKHCLRRNDDTFCCFGVLCNLYDDKQWKLSKYAGYYTYLDNGWMVPLKVACMLGVPPNYFSKGMAFIRKLMLMNDSEHTFLEIANYIEANQDKFKED